MSKTRLLALAAAVALCAGEPATAQVADPVTAEPLAFGPFSLDMGASLTEEYTDNVFATENDKEGDFVTILAPEIELSGQMEKFKLELGASAEIGRFATETSEDYDDALLRGEGQWNLSERTFLFGGLDYAWEHEERSSPEDVNGAEPVEFTEGSAFAGIATGFGPWNARVGVNARDLNFDDTPMGLGGSINNDDRDRLQSEVGGRLGYALGQSQQVFFQGIYDRRDYDNSTDDFGFERDSEGFNAAVGYAGRVGPFTGEVLAGVLHQDYEDSSFDSVTAPDFGAELTWRADPLTSLTLKLDRRLEETTLQGASSYLSSSAVLSASRWIARDLRLSGYLAYSENDYQDVGRTDYIGEAGLELRYHLTPNIYLGGGYGFAQRTSDAPAADYDTHTAYLRVGASLEPAYRGSDGLASADVSGFYAGVQGADGLLKTSVTGPRGAPGGGGTLDAEFGDFGLSGGAFAGYRASIGKLVVGAEIDGGLSALDWHHDGGRDFSVEAENSFGASVLAGTRIRNDVLLYGRAGVIGTEFKTDYVRGANSLTREEREYGMRFGIGAEFPLTGSLSGRMEYSLASYPDYDIPTRTGEEDNFASVANLATFGLVYHFGGQERSEPAPVDFGGFYAGVQAGHGGLSTENVGARTDPRVPFVLDAERAGMGTTGGIHVGYGETFGNVYLGTEIEAELANTNWDIDRSPDGRLYSVEKKGSVGASVRAGYVVNDAVLLYGRAGVANSWFENEYSFAGSDVDPTKSELGLRVGAGVEFAISDNVTMRLDYTRTDYGSYEVDYGSGVDSFDNAENLFRVGVSYRF